MSINVSAKRNGKIELLRFLMSVCVVLNHSFYVVGKENSKFNNFSIVVEFFFIVSGFLMAKHAISRIENNKDCSTWEYIKGRIRAFYPEVAVSWLFSLFVFSIANKDNIKEIIKRILNSVSELLLLKNSGWKIQDINGPTWYISSLLLASALIYPLLIKFHKEKHLFFYIGLLISGYLCQTYGSPRDPSKWITFTYKANVRALFEICYGITAFFICQAICQKQVTKFGRWIISILELSGYFIFFYYLFTSKGGKLDFLIIFILMFVIALSFSHQGALSDLFDNKLFIFLGKFSFPLYLSHSALAHNISNYYPKDMNYFTQTLIYVIASFAAGLLVMIVSDYIRKKRPLHSLLNKIFDETK